MIPIPYKGYVEASLPIANLPHYNDDVLLLVIPDNQHEERVPVQSGTLFINQLVIMTVGKVTTSG